MLNNDVNPKTLSRLELLKLAHTLNVSDADVMTRAELRAAIERARKPDPRPSAQPVTWLGVARRLLASIVEQGLHLPDAAAVIRGEASLRPFPGGPPPVATVTLARIYAAQGHLERAISTLDEVLESDPDHDLAREQRAQLITRLEERRAQERQQRAGEAAASATPATDSPPEEHVGEESSPASALLAAVPASESESEDASAPETRRGSDSLAPTSAEPVSAGPVPEPVSAESVPVPVSAEPVPEFLSAELLGAVGVPEPVSAVPEPVSAVPESAAPVLSEPAESPPAAAQTDVAPASAAKTPSTPVAVEARPAGLVLIETDEHARYLYWELTSPPRASGAEPHWVSVVTFTPRASGSERRERRFPVQHSFGAVRLEGLAADAIVRAKLSRSEAPDTPPLVVAGSVWAREAGALDRAELRFVPHAAAQPGALALRAADHLADAAPVYC